MDTGPYRRMDEMSYTHDSKDKIAIPRFCVEGLSKSLDFIIDFVLTWWQTDKKSRNSEQ